MKWLLLWISLCSHADLKPLINACLERKAPCEARVFSNTTQTQGLDLNGLLKTDYPSGIAYAATAVKLVQIRLGKLKAFLAEPDAIVKLISAVKTLKDVQPLSMKAGEVHLKLAIAVPVLSNFHTEDIVRTFETSDGRQVLEWMQVGSEGDLSDNHGLVIAQAEGEKIQVLVFGIHILKQERRVPWVGRRIASQFAKEHYANYIEALEKLLR